MRSFLRQDDKFAIKKSPDSAEMFSVPATVSKQVQPYRSDIQKTLAQNCILCTQSLARKINYFAELLDEILPSSG
ncbi:hypothetical protein FBGL_00950 [Flavobacterium glycines]|uniref:Uncharacterized protein n=1 Tax=Flavobacterium glycines TaxID=551990 RepID=A0A1B9DZG0_9FLAO|nr:hypothetical protein FBGL_00950 [Flavobacterium glycines]